MNNRRISDAFRIFVLASMMALAACDDRESGEPAVASRVTADSAAPAKTLVTADDYARAEKWLLPNMVKLVRNLSVAPHWARDSQTFWYPRQTEEGIEYTRVDVRSGRKSTLFDHADLAQALSAAGEKEVSAGQLALTNLQLSDDQTRIHFNTNDRSYDCALEPISCTSQAKRDVSGGILVAPDGRTGVRTQEGNLYLVELESGLEKPLTSDGEPHFGYGIYYGNWKADVVPRKRAGGDENFPPMETRWAPDSRHVLVTRLDERDVEEYHWLETVPDDGSFRPILHTARVPLTGEPEPKLDWFVIDTTTGTKVRLDLPYEALFAVHEDMLAIRKHWWSDDMSRLWVLAWGDTIKSAHLYEIDLSTGQAREAVAESMHPRTDTNTTSYNSPNVFVVNQGEQAIWFSQRSGWGHLYRYDMASGELINPITTGDWLVRDIIRVDEANQQIYFTGTHREGGNPYFRYLYRVGFDGSGLTLLTPEPADHMIDSPYNELRADSLTDGGVLSPDGQWLVYDYSTIDQPTQSAIRNVESGELVSVFEQTDVTQLNAAGWRSPEAFVAKASDGITDIHGVIYKPANFDPEQSYPVIDSQYASPLTAAAPHNFPASLRGVGAALRPASLAELGFVVIVLDARGTAFRDRKFSHHSWENLHLIGLDDHIAAMRDLAQTRPWMDLDRVGIHGRSYGGVTAFRAMLEFPEFFKVGISNAGPANFSAMYPDYHWEAFHGEAWYENESRIRPTPTSRPINWLNNEASLQAGNLKGKLLITVDELDENVLPASTLVLVSELMKQDINFDMIYFPNRPHAFFSPWATRTMWDYFVRHLHQQEPPTYKMTTASP